MLDPHFQNHFHDIASIMHFIRASSYAGVFLLSIFVSYVIPLPEIVLLILFGYVSKMAGLNLPLVIAVSAVGGIIGNNIVYRLSFFGNRYVESFNQKMRKNKLIQYEHLVIDNVGKTVYFLRFIAGVRFFGPVILGTLGAKWKKFFIFDSSANVLHAMLFVSIGYFSHRRIITTITEVEIARYVLLFSSVFIVGVLISIFAKKEKMV